MQIFETPFTLGCEVARRLKRNGVLHSDWARGRLVGAVDGIEICSSYVRCCDACMQREVEDKVQGLRRKDVQYYHRLVAVVLVSTDFPVPLGVRFQQDGELELGSIPPTFIHHLGRSRWRVDSDAFQTLTTQAHLKQPSVHQTCALVVLTMIRVLAYTLSMVFYHRQVVSHCRQTPPSFSQTARLRGYLFLPPRLDSS